MVFHTGFEEFYRRSLPVATMEQLVRQFPKLPVVFAHSLFPSSTRCGGSSTGTITSGWR